MEYLLFTGYLILFSWLITRTGFLKKSGFSNAQLIILFLTKIIAGIIYGWIGTYYGQFAYMFDTWGFHYTSLEETRLLFQHPAEYFSNFFYSGYENKYGGFFDPANSWWNDLKSNMFVKLLSVFNIFSWGNYYINVIYYCFLGMLGCIALYRVMQDVFPGKKWQLVLATFFIPSFLYWTSGIHKDGLVFTAISLLTYHVYFGFKRNAFSWISRVVIILCLVILLVFRNYILIILLPALLAWYWAHKQQRKIKIAFATVYIAGCILFFTSGYISASLDLPQAVVNRQKAFLQLQGNSSIRVSKLEPSAGSFLIHFPKALATSTLRPHPGDVKHLLSLAAAAENIFLLLIVLCFLIWRLPFPSPNAFFGFCIFFSLSYLLTIGYTVNFIGAIVRYRSIILPYLFVPMVCLTNWDKLFKLLNNNINNKNNINYFY